MFITGLRIRNSQFVLLSNVADRFNSTYEAQASFYEEFLLIIYDDMKYALVNTWCTDWVRFLYGV